jgi:ribosomal protein S18 acetylase RimI-like enzyme
MTTTSSLTATLSPSRIAVRKAQVADRATVSAVITAGFFDDPVTNWIIPDRADRPAVLPPVFGVYFDYFQPHGETYLTEDGRGAAVWLPAGRELFAPDQMDDFVRANEEAAGPYAGRLLELGEFFETHAPAEPHWHLQLIAVRPEAQGLGLGSALMDEVHQRLDRDGDAVYLEATTPRGRALYERHGFECIGEITLPDGPTMWQMWRAPAGR